MLLCNNIHLQSCSVTLFQLLKENLTDLTKKTITITLDKQVQIIFTLIRFASYTLIIINAVLYIYDLLEKTDMSISKKISCLPNHPLYNLLTRVKESSERLRTQTSLLPCVKTERF